VVVAQTRWIAWWTFIRHSRTVRSPLPVARMCPSGLNTTSVRADHVGPRRSLLGRLRSARHRWPERRVGCERQLSGSARGISARSGPALFGQCPVQTPVEVIEGQLARTGRVAVAQQPNQLTGERGIALSGRGERQFLRRRRGQQIATRRVGGRRNRRDQPDRANRSPARKNNNRAARGNQHTGHRRRHPTPAHRDHEYLGHRPHRAGLRAVTTDRTRPRSSSWPAGHASSDRIAAVASSPATVILTFMSYPLTFCEVDGQHRGWQVNKGSIGETYGVSRSGE
jgi:hypothetical protein